MQKKSLRWQIGILIILILLGSGGYIFYKYSQNSLYKDGMFVSKDVINCAGNLY